MTTPLSPEFVAGLTAGEGCFDLQFRRDIRKERKNNSVYYSWKVQFVINLKNKDLELIKKLPDVFKCGTVHTPTGYARFSIQDIYNLYHIVLPFFRKHPPYGNKQKDFELWAEAVAILYQNKTQKTHKGTRSFARKVWRKKSFLQLLKLHKLMQPYKSLRPQGYKWVKEAERFGEALED
ncbi:MAG: LAGLIDADG family homing endonuclease [bacterium]|nr:LAGLIDADG family homing endonuclease [bacterium]